MFKNRRQSIATRIVTTVALLVAASAAACSQGPAGSETADNAFNADEAALLFGDDRVAGALKEDLDKIPVELREYESLFKVGRQCARDDSKEVYIVEESTSRAGEEQAHTDEILPRAVVTGCNTNRTDPASVKMSYSLMIALISAPNDGSRDTMITGTPLEVMAFDDTTGRFNFYVFDKRPGDTKGTITRVEKKADGSVVDYVKAPGKNLETRQSTHHCFDCHANGGPLMNEMSEPWTNWVSTRKMFTMSAGFSGETEALVNEGASLKHDHNRSSLANQLEETMKAAIRTFINGETRDKGFAQSVIDGRLPGGVPRLMKSVFCQTEAKYLSVADTAPFELFIDPAALAPFNQPKPEANSPYLTLFPVRSEMDTRIEQMLVLRRYLHKDTVSAIRLVDDQNDIFSKTRCALLEPVTGGLPSDPALVDRHVAAKVKAALLEQPASPRREYALALLDEARTPASLDPARVAYGAELVPRYTAAVQRMNGYDPNALRELHARNKARQQAVRAMFPGASNPLPLLSEPTN